MLRNFFLILFLLSQTLAFAQTRRALVVGIGQYPEESGWRAISGDRDLEVVRRYLKINGFSESNISELKNSDATFQNIKSAFEKLGKSAMEGDVVYIHFSAHGQQVTDLDGDEADGFDEAIVPYDAFKDYRKGVYEGGNHITDDTLCVWLSALKDRVGDKGRIVVVNDACHSGDGSRDDDDEVIIRGTSDRFLIPQPRISGSATKKKLRWTYISACRSYQTNYEYVEPESGRSFGRLTYMIYLMHGMGMQSKSAEEFGAVLKSLFVGLSDIPQTPEVESDRMDGPVF